MNVPEDSALRASLQVNFATLSPKPGRGVGGKGAPCCRLGFTLS